MRALIVIAIALALAGCNIPVRGRVTADPGLQVTAAQQAWNPFGEIAINMIVLNDTSIKATALNVACSGYDRDNIIVATPDGITLDVGPHEAAKLQAFDFHPLGAILRWTCNVSANWDAQP